MLAAARRLDRPFPTQVTGKGIVNRLNSRVAAQFLVRSISLGNGKLARELPCLLQRPRSHRGDLHQFALQHTRDGPPSRNRSSAQYSPFHFFAHWFPDQNARILTRSPATSPPASGPNTR